MLVELANANELDFARPVHFVAAAAVEVNSIVVRAKRESATVRRPLDVGDPLLGGTVVAHEVNHLFERVTAYRAHTTASGVHASSRASKDAAAAVKHTAVCEDATARAGGRHRLPVKDFGEDQRLQHARIVCAGTLGAGGRAGIEA